MPIGSSEPHVVPNASDVVPTGRAAHNLEDEGAGPVAYFGFAGALVDGQVQDCATVFNHGRTIHLAAASVTHLPVVFVSTVTGAAISLFLEGCVLITFYAMELSFHSSSTSPKIGFPLIFDRK
jgi:hypothetical protein